MSIIKQIFGDPNAKEINKIKPVVEKVNSLEEQVQKLTDIEIKKRYQEIKKELADSLLGFKDHKDKEALRKKELETLEPFVPEVFALTREAAKRSIGQRHFDVQLIGGYALHTGKISEMRTGEGKTLVATLAASLNALTGKGVHVITVNDYLARRDAGWMGQVYNFLGLSVSTIIHDKALVYDENFTSENVLDEKTAHLKEISRKEAYLADITYGTNNEFGFDYLRDNMAQSLEQMVQRPLHFAIVDEVDSILIDEARTPLIISAPAEEATDKYYQFASLVKQLTAEKDYEIDEKKKAATLTDIGIAHMEKLLGIENIYEEYGIENVHHLEQALKAETLFKKDRDYVVKDGEIIIVDEFTGRLMFGRRYSEGLHQAIEAKENVQIKQESITLATISFQNYFRLYTKIAGMTGTAVTEAEEFHKIYNLDVVIIPTNKPMVREDLPDSIYKDETAKYNAVVADIKERNEKGQPVLVGTVSIEKNEILSDLLKRSGIKHEVLNAKNHEREAAIIAVAGQKGAVTVATNMAGRGTDIILGEGVNGLGGLHIIGTERHESRRIDNQLRGRAGRQGDPGSSQFYVSLEDDLMRIFGSDRVKVMMEKLGLPDDVPIQHSLITKSLEQAQRRVESQHFDVRKHLVEYDDVMNRQREFVYEKRRKALGSDSLRDDFIEIFEGETESLVRAHLNFETGEIEAEKLRGIIRAMFPVSDKELENINEGELDATIKGLQELVVKKYEEREKKLGNQMARALERAIYLRTIDMLWVDHLDAMDHLREGIGLRGYGQKDPLVEYKNESYRMFQKLLSGIQSEIAGIYFKADIATQQQAGHEHQDDEGTKNSGENDQESAIGGGTVISNKTTDSNVISSAADVISGKAKKSESLKPETSNLKPGSKVGRNDPCPCGSGKKYKKCHGRNT